MSYSTKAAFILATLLASLSWAGGYVSLSPGPGFTTRVNTPDGNYIVDPEPDGGAAWVGTEDEYMTRHAEAATGRQAMQVQGHPNEHWLISRKLPMARVGTTILAELDPSFSANDRVPPPPRMHGPPAKKHHRFVFLSWTPNRHVKPRAMFRDPRNGAVFNSFFCDYDMCAFQMPLAELNVPLTAVFIVDHEPPGAANIKSLAHLSYDAQNVLDAGIPIDPAVLKSLHELDPSVPSD